MFALRLAASLDFVLLILALMAFRRAIQQRPAPVPTTSESKTR